MVPYNALITPKVLLPLLALSNFLIHNILSIRYLWVILAILVKWLILWRIYNLRFHLMMSNLLLQQRHPILVALYLVLILYVIYYLRKRLLLFYFFSRKFRSRKFLKLLLFLLHICFIIFLELLLANFEVHHKLLCMLRKLPIIVHLILVYYLVIYHWWV